MRHPFTIPIGDWSNDGHGKMLSFNATAAKPIEAVREAFFAAKKKLPKCCPETFCSKYEDREIPKGTRKLLREAGAPVPREMRTDAMAAIVIWFLNQGDPDLDARLDDSLKIPMLPFYGYDEKKRHIDFIGYGLFS